MKRPGDSTLKQLPSEPAAERPGPVAELKGIIFQSDNSSTVGRVVHPPHRNVRPLAGRAFPHPG